MSDIILHHYPFSPFSEKIRAMLGYSGLSWQSVRTKEMPPRPMIEPLAGGYSRIPVAQIGADIFCDSNLIAEEIARISDNPKLALSGHDTQMEDFVRDAECRMFFACIMAGGSFTLQKKVFKTMKLLDIMRFFADRIQMGQKASIEMVGMKESRGMVEQYLEVLTAMLEDDYLFGNEPTIADFAVYHCIWFVYFLGEKKFVKKFPAVVMWLERVKMLGHGDQQNITAQDALDVAKANEPREIPAENQQHDLMGRQVSVAPNDYRQIATEGEFVGAFDDRWVVAKEDAKVGRVHLHFPKVAFDLTA